jgi:hypothetical protein
MTEPAVACMGFLLSVIYWSFVLCCCCSLDTFAGLVAGKLDQRQSCLQVHDVASRDVRPADTRGLADALGNW